MSPKLSPFCLDSLGFDEEEWGLNGDCCNNLCDLFVMDRA